MKSTNKIEMVAMVSLKPKYTLSEKSCRLSIPVQLTEYVEPKEKDPFSIKFFPYNIVVWGKMAEHFGDDLAVGTWLKIEGKLVPNNWKDDDGKWHNMIEIKPTLIEIARAPASPSTPLPADDDLPF